MDNLSSLLWKERTSDDNECTMILFVQKNRELVHRRILMSSCKVFAVNPKLLRKEEVNGQTMHVVDIDEMLKVESLANFTAEVKVQAFNQLLRSMYCQPMHLNAIVAQALMSMSDMFMNDTAFNEASTYLADNPESAVAAFVMCSEMRVVPDAVVNHSKKTIAENIMMLTDPARKGFKDLFALNSAKMDVLLADVDFSQDGLLERLLRLDAGAFTKLLLGLSVDHLLVWWHTKAFADYYDNSAKVYFLMKWVKTDLTGRLREAHKLICFIPVGTSLGARLALEKADQSGDLFDDAICSRILHRSMLQYVNLIASSIPDLAIKEIIKSCQEMKEPKNAQGEPYGWSSGVVLYKVCPQPDTDRFRETGYIGVTTSPGSVATLDTSTGHYSIAQSMQMYNEGTSQGTYNEGRKLTSNFLMLLNMKEGTLGFATAEGKYLGHAFSGLNGKTLYPACSTVTDMYGNGRPKPYAEISYLGRLNI